MMNIRSSSILLTLFIGLPLFAAQTTNPNPLNPITFAELSDDLVLACDQHQRFNSFIPPAERLQRLKYYFGKVGATESPSYILPVPLDIRDFKDISLFLLSDGVIINVCILGRKSTTVELIYSSEQHNDNTNFKIENHANYADNYATISVGGQLVNHWQQMLPSSVYPGQTLIFLGFAGDHGDKDVPYHETREVLLLRFNPANNQIALIDGKWMSFWEEYGQTRNGEYYFTEKTFYPAPDAPETLIWEPHFYIIREDRFQEVKEVDLNFQRPLIYGALASPYILPRQLLVRLAGETESQGCGLGNLGFQEFNLYIGGPGRPVGEMNQIKNSSVRAFGNPAKGPGRVITGITDASRYARWKDGFGYAWFIKKADYRTRLPQVPLDSPYRCIAEKGPCYYLVDDPYRFQAPACPVLKKLAGYLKKSPSARYLVIPVTGEVEPENRFTAYATIQIVEGDWDERFTGPKK